MKPGIKHQAETRKAIAEAVRAYHEVKRRGNDEAKRARDYRAYVRAYYILAEGPGDVPIMRALARRALETCDAPAERARWRRHLSALEQGRRVKVAQYPAEIIVSKDLDALDRGRAVLADDRRLAREFEKE